MQYCDYKITKFWRRKKIFWGGLLPVIPFEDGHAVVNTYFTTIGLVLLRTEPNLSNYCFTDDRDKDYYWIGLKRIQKENEFVWQWQDGEGLDPASRFMWEKQPLDGRDCAALTRSGGRVQILALSCLTTINGYVCSGGCKWNHVLIVHIAINAGGMLFAGSIFKLVKSDALSPTARPTPMFLRSCVIQALSGGVGPRLSLQASARYREYHENLIFRGINCILLIIRPLKCRHHYYITKKRLLHFCSRYSYHDSDNHDNRVLNHHDE